jgi:DNA-binding XRE family transcriptional regulator
VSKCTTFDAILGAIVVCLRDREGVSQDELADALGVNQSSMSRKETGNAPFSLEDLRLVARKFGLVPHRLLQSAEGTCRMMRGQGWHIVKPGGHFSASLANYKSVRHAVRKGIA